MPKAIFYKSIFWSVLGIGCLFLFAYHVHFPSWIKPQFSSPYIACTSLDDKILKEQALLYDDTPLYLPTRWNFAMARFPSFGQQNFLFPYFDYTPDLEEKFSIWKHWEFIDTNRDLLTYIWGDEYWEFLSNLGKSYTPIHALPERLGYAEVMDIKTGKMVREITFGDKNTLKGGKEMLPLWERSLEYLLYVGKGEGLDGCIQLTTCGIDSLEKQMYEQLQCKLPQLSLPAGVYIVRIGP